MRAGDEQLTPTRPKPRRVLALLLLNANRVVPRETLIEELWDGEPPQSAVTTVQTYIYQLRNLLGRAPAGGGARLETVHGGYTLLVQREQVDRYRFEDLVAEGRRARAAGDLVTASATLSEALDLWRGPALADVEAGPVIARQLAWLQELRMDALQTRIEIDLALGRHRALVGELKALVAAHPLHEWFYGQLMMALHRSSRRAEALSVYQQLRATLRRELALEPSAEIRELERVVLTTDPAPLLAAS
ncbi:MAG TPA: AfsR/SARP family transcriptional regulator [Egibacteraceae bacterium]